MQGVGEKFRARAESLGLSDSEVARRVGISASRYGKYIRNDTEPDYALLVRICEVLSLTPNDLLLIGQTEPDDRRDLLRARLLSSLHGLDEANLNVLTEMVEAGAAVFRKNQSE